jgi:hypothetical protein
MIRDSASAPAPRSTEKLPVSAEKMLARLAAEPAAGRHSLDRTEVALLIAADLVVRNAAGGLEITAAGRAFLARRRPSPDPLDPFLAQHLDVVRRPVAGGDVRIRRIVDEAESPLTWLARRKGPDGRPLIDPVQLAAGERLRRQFTAAQLAPRVTADWTIPVTDGPRSPDRGPGEWTEAVIAARQQVRRALAAVGPEFAGLLLDVCCFLKGLEDVERERRWPPRSAKVVLQLALDRLARHYRLTAEARGPARGTMRTWHAEEAAPVSPDGGDPVASAG